MQSEIAYLLGAESALFANFNFHHGWTYRKIQSNKRKSELLLQFHMSFWSGALINFAIFVAIIRILQFPEVWGLVGGSVTALFWNFFWTKFFIWKRSSGGIKDISNTEKSL